MPRVSVIIPAYNRAQYILETLESIFAQTYTDYEIIVIDDGSTDDTRDVLQPLIDVERIRYIFQENQGVSAARNHGIRLAEGELIAFLDTDDINHLEKLALQAAYLDDHPDVALVHSNFTRFDDSGAEFGRRDTSHLTGFVYRAMLLDWSVLIPPSVVMVRADALREAGDFDESMAWAEDIDVWRRIARKHPFGVVPETLTRMRIHGDNASDAKIRPEAFAAFERYLRKAFAEDPSLLLGFQRRALAKLYANAGHNLLAEGTAEHMPLSRQFSLKAIRQWPLQWSAYLGYAGSFIGLGLRDRLLGIWRNVRDKRA